MDPLFWALLLVALAVVLIVLEVFLPSGGLLGVAAATSLVVAIAITLVGGTGWWRFLIVTSTTVVVVPVTVAIAMRVLPKTTLGRTVLAIPDVGDAVLPEAFAQLRQQIGRFGLSRSPMMPAGVVVIDGKRYDAVSEAGAIDAGRVIRVVAVRVGRLIVVPEPEMEPTDLAAIAETGTSEIVLRSAAQVIDRPVDPRPEATVETQSAPLAPPAAPPPAPEPIPAGPPATEPGPPVPSMSGTDPAEPPEPVVVPPDAFSDEEEQLRRSLEDLGLTDLAFDRPDGDDAPTDRSEDRRT